ncbi:MAG: hypothetical protein NC828_01735 [Candidatus Omnitrophica bacterium]|nr:hypothetical protein [Candidatus Omnitrophota bacterium]
MRIGFIVMVIIAGLLGLQFAYAGSGESKPAVSGINAKVSGGYADIDADSVKFGSATVTLPLTHSFGLAIDGLGGDYSASSLWGAGGNLFWRNPDKGLIGIIGSNVMVGANNASLGGVNGELYLGQFSILADAGYQTGDTIKHGAFSDLILRYYPMDNLALNAGCAYSGGNTAGVIGIEYMPRLKIFSGLTLFARGSWGENNFHSVTAGVKYYFGKGKTLKQKHREDDPENIAFTGLVMASQGQGGFSYSPPAPPAGEDGEEEPEDR